ncbi:roquin-1 [Episyrphus balteatus]|uniref:roquin-1 n=1 Tax=Episyrphus balteatus TaxID=286459 RepID=UPI0024850715|nr:roquin-1 [Episyrphus balteatus]XP_055841328.1 roquin-1 [Episyrphus balteatus]
MPIQAPSWTDFLSCPVCCNEFAENQRPPISLGCGHTICRTCLATLHNKQCPFDQTSITTDLENLPINYALLLLVTPSNSSSCIGGSSSSTFNNGAQTTAASLAAESEASTTNIPSVQSLLPDDKQCYKLGKKCIESLALHLKPFINNGNFGSLLSRPMQRKLVTLVNCQLMEDEGRSRALRAARSLGERTVTELILQHQNPQQLSSNLWAAVRSRGCQFLGPAMQEEVLKLVLLALEDGSALSRKVLVMFVVQRLEPHFPQASKTSIGHVVQLLYRASCFKVSKREADSSLMQLKEEFRTYDALRREHDAQIVQIATEAGLRIAPDQWSSLLYGDTIHKSHMQSIIDKLQTPQSFAQSVQELVIALQRTGDPANLSGLRTHLKHLASIDSSVENSVPTWQEVAKALDAVKQVVIGLVEFVQHHGNRKLQESSTTNPNTKYKISLCRDLTLRRICPRGTSCTFAHSDEELERYRAKNRKNSTKTPIVNTKKTASDYLDAPPPSLSSSCLPPDELPSPLRFGNVVSKPSPVASMSAPYHSQSQGGMPSAPPSYVDLIPPPMHGQSPIPQSQRHRYDNHYSGLNFPPPPPPPRNSSSIVGGGMSLTSPRSHHSNFPQSGTQQPPVKQPVFHTKSCPTASSFGPSDMYSGSGNFGSQVPGSGIQQSGIRPSRHNPVGHTTSYMGTSNEYGKLTVDGIRQSNLWDHQRQQHQHQHQSTQHQHHHQQQQQQQQQQHGGNLMNIGLNPQNASSYMGANSSSNSDAPSSPIFPIHPDKKHLEYLKDLEFTKTSAALLNGSNIYKSSAASQLAQLVNNNNNNNNNSSTSNTTTNNNHRSNNILTKDDLLNAYWQQAASSQSLQDVSAAASLLRDTRDSFVRSDSILDEDNLPFDVPTSISKFGPICPMYKGFNQLSDSLSGNNNTLNNIGGLTSFQEIANRMSNAASGSTQSWLYNNDNSNGNNKQMDTSSSSSSSLFNNDALAVNVNFERFGVGSGQVGKRGESSNNNFRQVTNNFPNLRDLQKFSSDLQSFNNNNNNNNNNNTSQGNSGGGNSSQHNIISRHGSNAATNFDFGLSSLQIMDTSDNNLPGKHSTLSESLWNNNLPRKQPPIGSPNFWGDATPSSKEVLTTKNQVPEDEVGIDNGMRELEIRLKSELAIED